MLSLPTVHQKQASQVRNPILHVFTHDGLVLTIEAYGDHTSNDEHNLGQAAATVLKLMSPFLNKGYHVFTENYYNSVALSKFHLEKNTYVTGTLRKVGKGNPKEVKAEMPKRGGMVWRVKEDVVVCK